MTERTTYTLEGGGCALQVGLLLLVTVSVMALFALLVLGFSRAIR